eukprot:TRINITY_DN8823_c0_g1_i3.p1 TRINITY_DN8823_c0_g1~~TRINITY_DN8823_c0_g1_i3.p1  ORF type:complete len:326 (-),score=46.20 TRINITY_DN8823_c0_g1_i3:22-999(-)
MWDNMTADVITGSTQQFWVFDDSIYYCGWIKNFFSPDYVPISRHFYLQDVSATSISWCDSPSPSQCNYLQWTLQVSQNSLELTVLLTPPIMHLHVIFYRATSTNTTIPYNSTQPNCVPPSASSEKPPHPCPYHQLSLPQSLPPSTKPAHLEGYQYCYQLNDATRFRIYWTLSPPDKLMMAITIPAVTMSSNWIAIGFGPTFPGMNVSDIALGYMTASGNSCARTMTGLNKYGTPDNVSKMPLLGNLLTYTNGILSFEFERTLGSGYNPIVLDPPSVPGYTLIWAVGEGPLPNCAVRPSYHGNTRGYRTINFQNPEKVFDKFRVCS